MRQSLSVKSSLSLHQACAIFLHFMSKLETAIPGADFSDAAPKLRSVFLMGGMDGDLLNAATTSVPPGDLKSIGAFRLGV